MDERIVYIYVLINKADRIAYVGQTMDVERRKKEHFEKPFPEIKEDIGKFGIDSFEFKVIDKCFYNHRHIVEAYNTRKIAENYALYNVKIGMEHNVKTKKRLSIVTSGKNNGMYNQKNENAINGQKVLMKNKNGDIIREFVSVKEVINFLKLKGHSKLYEACRKNIKYKGYYWEKDFRRI